MIYFIANANAVSGGPELQHQCCSVLKKFGYDSAIIYYEKLRFGVDPSEEVVNRYSRYNCTIVKKIIDDKSNSVVFAEGQWFFLPKFHNVRKVFWWLSVDNYFASFKLSYAKLYAPFGGKSKKYNPFAPGIMHCCQSEYARQFLIEKGVDQGSIFSLFDYLSSEFIDSAKSEVNVKKKDCVLYNPRKGFEFTQHIIEAAPEFSWVPLENMTHEKMVEVMSSSKVYIDFGNHPGKDRIPREAVMCGCVVITGKRGAAKNNVDIPIPHEYKFEDDISRVPEIIKKIQECFDSYEVKRKDFDKYREIIIGEEDEFNSQVKNIGSILTNG